MNTEQAERLREIVMDALECVPDDRAAFLTRACAGDDALLAEAQSLVRYQEKTCEYLEGPALATETAIILGAEHGELPPGEILGDYRIVRFLGEGGMGEVYLGEDTRLERAVAVKLLKRNLSSDALLRRFRNERTALAGLTHPNIARLYGGAISPGGHSYLVMEFVEGERLDRYCEHHNLGVDERLSIFRKICAAVSHAHQHLVVHRDLKPANILVTADGEPKLLDFGIAKLLDTDATTESAMTATIFAPMTPEYASPEQLRNEAITTATDVYSLGVILYELLTGQRPYYFKTRRADELIRVVCEVEPPAPSTALRRQKAEAERQKVEGRRQKDGGNKSQTTTKAKDSPSESSAPSSFFLHPSSFSLGDLDNIVAKAMRKEPELRYPSAAAFSEDVRRHCAGMPVEARRPTFAYRAGKFIRRNRLGVGLVAAIVLIVLAGMATTIWEARRAARRFEDVRRLAKSILFEIEPRMAEVSGNTATRALLTRRALEYLDSLSAEAGGNRELQRELAASYERVGDVQGNPAGANLGQLQDGLASYAKARTIRRVLVKSAPHDAWARHELAKNLEQTGTMLWWNNDTAGPLANYREALDISRALVSEQPKVTDFRHELANVLMREADVDTWDEETARSLVDLNEALPILQGLLKDQPHDPTAQIDVARCLSRIGVAHREMSDFSAAVDALHQAQAIMETLLAQSPDSRPALIQYAFELNMEVESDNAQGSPESIARACEIGPRAIHIFEGLSAKDAADTTMQHDLAAAHYAYATTLQDSGRWTDALEQLRVALTMNDQLTAHAPDNAEYPRASGYLHEAMGECEWQLGQLEQADRDAESAQDRTQSVLTADPENGQAKRDLVNEMILRGRIRTTQQRPQEARHFYSDALSSLEALVAKHGANQTDTDHLKFLHQALDDGGK